MADALRVTCSKALAYILRVAPVGDSVSPAELRQSPLLFKGGWVPLEHVLQRSALRAFSRDFVLEVIGNSTLHTSEDSRQRFELMTHAEHGQVVRACYGHRFDIENMGRDLDAMVLSDEQMRVKSLCDQLTQCSKALALERKKHKKREPAAAVDSTSSSTDSLTLRLSSSTATDAATATITDPVTSQLAPLSTAELQLVLSELRKRKAINSTTLKLLLCERVEVLELSDEFVSDAMLRRIMLKCPKVRELHLGNAHGAVTDKRLAEIATALPHLTTLDISRCHHVTPRGIAHLATLEHLTRLVAFGLPTCVQALEGLAAQAAASGRTLTLELATPANIAEQTRIDARRERQRAAPAGARGGRRGGGRSVGRGRGRSRGRGGRGGRGVVPA